MFWVFVKSSAASSLFELEMVQFFVEVIILCFHLSLWFVVNRILD